MLSIPYITKKTKLHKRSRIDFTLDTLDNDKDESNAKKTPKRICKNRLDSKLSQKNHDNLEKHEKY